MGPTGVSALDSAVFLVCRCHDYQKWRHKPTKTGGECPRTCAIDGNVLRLDAVEQGAVDVAPCVPSALAMDVEGSLGALYKEWLSVFQRQKAVIQPERQWRPER
jgi:hypothetical protein